MKRKLKSIYQYEWFGYFYRCPKCEKVEVRQGDKFCSNCGYDLKSCRYVEDQK